MSEAREPGEDRFDALERRYEERQRAAQDLAGMLGTAAEAREPEASTEAQATAEPTPNAVHSSPCAPRCFRIVCGAMRSVNSR